MAAKTKQITVPQHSNAYRVLLRARITEKAHSMLALNKYVFQVSLDSTKRQVKTAVELVYGVVVHDVCMVRIQRKRRFFGRTPGWKSAFKKAIVTLQDGESIDLFRE